MIKSSQRNSLLLLVVFLLSLVLVFLAFVAQNYRQGPINVPGDMDFMAYLPGRYTLYRESLVDPNSQNLFFPHDIGLNETLLFSVRGCGHLDRLPIKIWNHGGIPYYCKEANSSFFKTGMPFAELEILWP